MKEAEEYAEELDGIAEELEGIPRPTASYDPAEEALTIQEDLDQDGIPDITLKVRVGVILKRAWKPAVAAAVLAALAYLHSAGAF